MHRLSATIITRNEEKRIALCLESLQGIVDEIVVVDSYSTDRTIDICRRYGCKISSREFAGFGSQRQYATGLTRHNYVLSIDADEIIDEELRQNILELKERGFDHRVYKIMVRNYFCGDPLSHSGYEPKPSVRLFNKRYANWNLRDIADSVSFADSVQPEMIRGALHHYRCSTIDDYIKKENRIAALGARVLATKKSSIWAVTPPIMAAMEYLKAIVKDHAWLDGGNGLSIAARRAKTTYLIHKMARKILIGNKK